MATLNLTPDQDAIDLEMYIAAPPERVFQAVTDPRQLIQWWGQKGMYHCTNWNADVRPGGKWCSDGVSDKDGSTFSVSGEYLEVDPPHSLVYTWIASWTGAASTTVRWNLEASQWGTVVRVRHEGFKQSPGAARDHYLGWQRVTAWMQAFVERGETVASRPAFVPPQGS